MNPLVPMVALLLLTSCGPKATPENTGTMGIEATSTESENLDQFFERNFDWRLSQSPQLQTQLGKKTNYGMWDDISAKQASKKAERWKTDLAYLQSNFDIANLDSQAKLSYQLFEYEHKVKIEGASWRLYNYPVNQMHGLHAEVPAFLINYHKIDNVADAEAYISRLHGIQTLFAQLEAELVLRQDASILPPRFVFAHVLRDCENLIKGKPFDEGEDSTLLGDFRKKITTLNLSKDERERLLDLSKEALLRSVKPAYRSLIAILQKQQKVASDDDGVWRLPKGGEFYRFALRRMTTTDMSAVEIHKLGLEEVARIHGEMREIMKLTKYEGSLQEFFSFMRSDPQFYFPNSDKGRAQYLAAAVKIIDTMRLQLDKLFITKPKSEIVVKAVEAFREQSAGKAFYSGPSPDGSRPGTYYANLYRMERMPSYQMEALAYHEGIPGHHMQVAIATELTNVPKFRRHGGYTAYSEGWGLYSEYLAKEVGMYADPYSDFGRLAMELWRACRLVVDTGIHEKHWTRQRAIDYLSENTPNPIGDVVNAIERYIVMPSQATAYKIGMIEILRLRKMAKEKLGERFDIRQFHEVVVSKGSMPLAILAQRVEAWVESELAAQ